MNERTVRIAAIATLVIALVVAAYLAADDDTARSAIRSAGYEDVSIGAPAFLRCSEDDSLLTSREFEATGSRGQRVAGVACCDLVLRGCTIRW